MIKQTNKRRAAAFIFAALLIMTAIICRRCVYSMEKRSVLAHVLDFVRSSCYLVLYSFWAISLEQRIIHRQTRKILVGIALLELYWMLVRTIKFLFVVNLDGMRWLWYMYYVAMIMIPMLALLAAMTMGKNDEYRLPGWLWGLVAISVGLVVFVLSNDFHQLVFSFPADRTLWHDDYRKNGIGFYIVITWEFLCAVSALTLICVKARIPKIKKLRILPFLPLVFILVYSACYMLKLPFIKLYMGDFTAVACVSCTLILECCIQCHMICTNSHYKELFQVNDIRTQIIDDEGHLYLKSDKAKPLDMAIVRQSFGGPVLMDNGVRVSVAPIRGGDIVWEDDVSKLITLNQLLDENNEELQTYNEVLQEDVRQRAKRLKLEEKNRIFDEMQKQTAGQVEALAGLLKQLRKASTDENARQLLRRVVMLGTYLKRKNNMIFMALQEGYVTMAELKQAFRETREGLKVCQIESAYRIETSEQLPGAAMQLYDVYHEILQALWDVLTGIYVSIEEYTSADAVQAAKIHKDDSSLVLTIVAECNADLKDKKVSAVSVSDITEQLVKSYPKLSLQQDDDGLWYLNYSI